MVLGTFEFLINGEKVFIMSFPFQSFRNLQGFQEKDVITGGKMALSCGTSTQISYIGSMNIMLLTRFARVFQHTLTLLTPPPLPDSREIEESKLLNPLTSYKNYSYVTSMVLDDLVYCFTLPLSRSE